MALECPHEIIYQQLGFGGGYNRNAVLPLLGEVQRERGRAAVDGLIRGLDLKASFGLKAGTDSSRVGR